MPKKPRTTSNAFGKKFLAVMADKGLGQDFAVVAAAFGVAVPSVYDWIDYGRFKKDRYAKLVEWSGRPLDWWFDIPPLPIAIEEPRGAYVRTMPEPPAAASDTTIAGRFRLLDLQRTVELPLEDLRVLEGAWILAAKQLGFSLTKPAVA